MPDDKSSTRVGGRPSFEPTQSQRQMVEAMAGCGVPEADIAIVVGIAPKTLRKHFRDELDTGHIKASAKVAGNLYGIATGSGREAVTAAISGSGHAQAGPSLPRSGALLWAARKPIRSPQKQAMSARPGRSCSG